MKRIPLKRGYYHAPFEAGGVYHIYNRGINGTAVFNNDRNRKFFLSKLKKYLAPYFDFLAWVLMGNHYHLLVQVKAIDAKFLTSAEKEKSRAAIRFMKDKYENEFLEDQFRRMLSSYVLAFNKENNRYGSLFVKRFSRIEVNSHSYILNSIRYILLNPVNHGFVSAPSEWFYSSWHEMLGGEDGLINRVMVTNLLRGKINAFLHSCNQEFDFRDIDELFIE